MTELSREILRDWQVRKTKAQKLRFIEFLQSRLPGLRVEEGGWPLCRNLVLGDPENADVVFTAHYDTCARLPFPNFITPNNLLIYLFQPEQGVILYGTRHEICHLVGRYYLTREQLFYHLNVVLKYLAMIPLVILFVSTTNPSEFAASLNRIGVSYKISYSVALALRYIPGIG